MSAIRKVIPIVLLAFAAFTAGAQTQAINGSIRGRVTDAAGASVPPPRSRSQRRDRIHSIAPAKTMAITCFPICRSAPTR